MDRDHESVKFVNGCECGKSQDKIDQHGDGGLLQATCNNVRAVDRIRLYSLLFPFLFRHSIKDRFKNQGNLWWGGSLGPWVLGI